MLIKNVPSRYLLVLVCIRRNTMSKATKRTSKRSASALIFESQNYVLLAISALLITVGFVAMYLDGQFLGFVSLTVSPIVIMTGYAGVIYAILKRPRTEEPVEKEA